jgi:tetrathionate reductase subunit B
MAQPTLPETPAVERPDEAATEPDEPAFRFVAPRVTRREALAIGVVAIPSLAGATAFYAWLTSLTAAPPAPNAEPIVTAYDATAHRWGFVVDTRTCIGCGMCVVACKTENNVPVEEGYARTWVERHIETADGVIHVDSPDGGYDGYDAATTPTEIDGSPVTAVRFVPRLCMQCENSPCTVVCPVGATFRNADGIVLVDEDRCIGCGYCVVSCPYGARYIVPAGEVTPRGVAGVADKCTFCYHRVVQGLRPACVEVCPVGARIFGDLNDPESPVSVILAEEPSIAMRESLGTSPRVRYVGMESEVPA